MTSRKADSGSYEKLSEMEWKRKKGYRMLENGLRKSEIAKKLRVDRKTVYNWSARMEKGIDWKNRKQRGAESRLSAGQKCDLKKIIDAGPREYGYDTDLWTLKRIADVIMKEFDVHYNPTYVWWILHELNYSSQMPVAVSIEKDPAYVKEWLEKNYPEYMKEAKENNATILFQDESGVQSRPNVRKTWSRRGKRPVMRVKERRDRISISSAVTPDGDLYFMIKEGSMNGDDTIIFLEQLLSEINGFLYMFWDNIMIHRSTGVKAFLGAHNDRLITRRIPAYSPELNPDEFVWNALKYQELPNFCPTNLDDLKSKVTFTMNRLKSDPQKLRNIIRGSSLPLPPFMGKD
ncbi:ISXoo2 transposase [mine drainage metagenome]|uniref:ISXoo2 transposase n=1 Tax=mine drainage metagenome TaxID=410659 RepID=T1B1E9_9ZZZZ